MRIASELYRVVAVGLLGAGFALAGCKTAPDLPPSNALSLIQAYYDAQPAAGVAITVDSTGLKKGLDAKYWKLTKVYPNNRWADYTLTDEGKKVLKLAAGGDVIEWRPDPGSAPHFVIETLAASHPKAKDVLQPHDEVLAGVDTGMGANFTEMVNLDSLPTPLQDMAHNPRTKLSSRRSAEFALDGNAWKVHGIR